ncbi:Aluminum-activated malate transporter 13 [Linum perenne]
MLRMESAVIDINDQNVVVGTAVSDSKEAAGTKGGKMEELNNGVAAAAENDGGGGGVGMKVVRKWVHSAKVGVAVVVVSLLYFLDPLYKEVGDDNAIWAIMTVVVIFEFHAGATVSKGVNRIIGTVLGGGFGCLVATTGQKLGGIGNSIIVGVSIFAVAGGGTYYRQIHSKKLFDYGANIFILTFSLVAVSGLRIENVIEIARERLLMILLGFMTCVLTSLFFFPIWASDELHCSLCSRFHQLATSLEGCVEEYFRVDESSSSEKMQPAVDECFKRCEAVLLAKSKDDSLVNSARWEPWHGKFGLSYPWERYKQTGHLLNDVASSILSLKLCLKSPRQGDQSDRDSIREPCEAAAASLVWTLGEMGDSIRRMRRCDIETSIVPELKSARLELSRVVTTPFKRGSGGSDAEALGMASFVFGLTEMVEVLEELAKQVEELGQTAGFHET